MEGKTWLRGGQKTRFSQYCIFSFLLVKNVESSRNQGRERIVEWALAKPRVRSLYPDVSFLDEQVFINCQDPEKLQSFIFSLPK